MCFFDKVVKEYKEARQNNNKATSFWMKVWETLPTYKTNLLNSLLVALDSLFVGFLVTLLFEKAQIFAQQNRLK